MSDEASEHVPGIPAQFLDPLLGYDIFDKTSRNRQFSELNNSVAFQATDAGFSAFEPASFPLAFGERTLKKY